MDSPPKLHESEEGEKFHRFYDPKIIESSPGIDKLSAMETVEGSEQATLKENHHESVKSVETGITTPFDQHPNPEKEREFSLPKMMKKSENKSTDEKIHSPHTAHRFEESKMVKDLDGADDFLDLEDHLKFANDSEQIEGSITTDSPTKSNKHHRGDAIKLLLGFHRNVTPVKPDDKMDNSVKLDDHHKKDKSVKLDDHHKKDKSAKLDDHHKKDKSVKAVDHHKKDKPVKPDDHHKKDKSAKLYDHHKKDKSVKLDDHHKKDKSEQLDDHHDGVDDSNSEESHDLHRYIQHHHSAHLGQHMASQMKKYVRARFRSNSDSETLDNHTEVNSNKPAYRSSIDDTDIEELKRQSTSTEKHHSFRKSLFKKFHQLGGKHHEDGHSKKHKDSQSVFYVLGLDNAEVDHSPQEAYRESESSGSMQEKRKKVAPEGTIEYTVRDRDTIERVAAIHDTTPSELKKINRLSSWMIFSGQTLFIPDKDFVPPPRVSSPVEQEQAMDASSPTSSLSPPLVSPTRERPTMDVPIVKLADRPPTHVPGHAERQTPVCSPTDKLDFEMVAPLKLSVDNAKQLDQDCLERFIKLKVKHITDGQGPGGQEGVVKGTLLVTPNAVMFDPSVLDPLVQEHGADKYGMIAPMDMIVSAAMYHDIAVMNQRGRKQSDGTPFPKPEIYHDPSCCRSSSPKMGKKLNGANAGTPGDSAEAKGLGQLAEADETSCSCQNADDQPPIETLSVESTPVKGDNSKCESVDTSAETLVAVSTQGVSTKANKEEDDIDFILGSDKPGDKLSPEADNDSVFTENNNVSNVIEAPSSQNKERSESSPTDKTESDKKQTQIGSIVYLPVAEDDQGKVTLQAFEETQTALSKLSTEDFQDVVKSDKITSESGSPSGNATSENKDISRKRTSSTSSLGSLGSFNSSPHLNAFVNYATGFFQRNSEDKNTVKDIKEVLQTETRASDIPVIMSAPPSRSNSRKGHHRAHLDSTRSDISVESAVSMDEYPQLFSMDYNKFRPRQSVQYVDPPLYLCLRLGTPQDKNVFHNYSIESYGKLKKKPEYWFSIPREKVDNLYAFFVQWTPEIYGDEDDMDAEKRGFVVINENDELNEEIDTFDEHFGPNSSFQKDWEIISQAEAVKRRSIVFDIPLPLPEMIGESAILTNEHIEKLCHFMPARTVGYPWTLIYSTDQHGFSLKTLYRAMQGLDSPILIVVKDTTDIVFGAMTSCELKMSDHFYGTGESFLYTFFDDFRVFPWTGDNNFFLKGNADCLSIGAGKGMFGLWFDGDIFHGRTNCCETYNNEILTVSEDFVVKGFEAWAFFNDF